jgi:hypothetical protein
MHSAEMADPKLYSEGPWSPIEQEYGKVMKLYKSDARYKYHNEGFHYIAEFGTCFDERIKFGALRKVLEEKYGPQRKYVYVSDWQDYRHELNPVWRSVITSAHCKRRRIYVKDESVITFAMLMIG